LLIENKPLKRWIAEEKKRRDGLIKGQIVGKAPVSMEGIDPENTNEVEVWDGLIPEANFISEDYDPVDFMKIIKSKKDVVTALKRHGKPKYLADRTLFIFDDQVGSPMFRGSNGNEFKAFCTKHRHYSASMIVVSQGYKEVPKTIRTNFTCLIIFEM
jgi:hypothetical protein